uniref:Tubulin-specific chaperone A n=1 Tax=Globisporangium ultimum (strain ATCC 200006 / CBS 805.95 / DAOM BR144) TaxID=431595 RepID=K3XAJ4_GLOUD
MAERQFKIKVGTLRRVKKDLEYYAKEHAAQALKIEKMRADGKDEYDVKKQEEVLVETETMLPDCQMRLKEAAQDVENFIASHRVEVEPLAELMQEAQALLDAVPELL